MILIFKVLNNIATTVKTNKNDSCMTPDFTIELCIYVYVGIGTTTQITCVSMNEYQEEHILTYTYIHL